MSENKNFSRILALSLSQVLPIAQRAVEADTAKAEARAAEIEKLAAESQSGIESDAQILEMSAAGMNIGMDQMRISRGEQALKQFNETDQSVAGLSESDLDDEFQIKFEV